MNGCNKDNFKRLYKEALNVLQQAAIREKQTIQSVSELSDGNVLVNEFIETYKKKIDEELDCHVTVDDGAYMTCDMIEEEEAAEDEKISEDYHI